MVDILVVDDSPVFRHALRNLIEGQDNWRVCAEASDGVEAIERFGKHKPDVVVIDFRMPEMNGLDAAREMQRQAPQVPILMVTLYLSSQLTQAAKRVGIKGACSKTNPGCVVDAVEALLKDRTYFQN